ncbi:hypothetical protein CPLU01_01388 [Colletotrichum plurivorum]|uniref:Uncharacterized protein n=1 Tax=Colletotrichum plurivorum TaxID=2175906 RepID=A0A8H6U1Y2_9PEZI|nr:hypothetical protein CPLU01_01388 [Colletotrichum plurivorum]
MCQNLGCLAERRIADFPSICHRLRRRANVLPKIHGSHHRDMEFLRNAHKVLTMSTRVHSFISAAAQGHRPCPAGQPDERNWEDRSSRWLIPELRRSEGTVQPEADGSIGGGSVLLSVVRSACFPPMSRLLID